MPYISIVVPTMRVGGIDIILDGLSKQQFTDFELVISDGLYQYRKDIIAKKSKNYNFPIKHIEPFNNPFPTNAFCRYANSGLAYADCELVVFITDYTFLEADCLLKHAVFHSHNPKTMYMGPHQYYQLKNIHPSFNSYLEVPANKDNDLLYNHSNNDTLKYAEDVKNRKYDHLMFSLLEEEFNSDIYDFELDPLLKNADPKVRQSSGLGNLQLFHGKNESCGLENILKINGWNEVLDNGHAYQDLDLADRLGKFGGITDWYVDSTNVARIINPRPVFPHGYRGRSVGENHSLWAEQCSQDYPIQNKWSLREVNELNRMKSFYEKKLENIKFD